MARALKTKEELKKETGEDFLKEFGINETAAEKSAAEEKGLYELEAKELLDKVYDPRKAVTTEPMLFRDEDREKDEKSPLWEMEFIKNFKAEQAKKNKEEKEFLWIDKSEGKIKKVYNDPNREKGESYSESREKLLGENIEEWINS